MRKANRYLGFITVLLGIAIIAGVFISDLPLILRGLPGPGFFPFWLSFGIIIFGIFIFNSSFKKAVTDEEEKEQEESIFNKEEFYNFFVIIGGSVSVIFLTKYIGLLSALGLAVSVMTKLFGEKRLHVIFLVGIGTTAVFYGIFKLFLNVPLPIGPLGF